MWKIWMEGVEVYFLYMHICIYTRTSSIKYVLKKYLNLSIFEECQNQILLLIVCTSVLMNREVNVYRQKKRLKKQSNSRTGGILNHIYEYNGEWWFKYVNDVFKTIQSCWNSGYYLTISLFSEIFSLVYITY